jgi:hypothetical protein
VSSVQGDFVRCVIIALSLVGVGMWILPLRLLAMDVGRLLERYISPTAIWRRA